jgi:hypothetical protein
MDQGHGIPAGLVEEKVLVWLFNAFEIYTKLIRRVIYPILARFSRVSGKVQSTYRRASSKPPHGD